MMHGHQLETLTEELRLATYDGLTAEAALAMVNTLPVIRRLARTRYPDVTGFATGTPGFPSKVRRNEFDAAWRAAGRA